MNQSKTDERGVLGGANVAADLANLDVYVYVGGVAGQDTHGNLLQDLLDSNEY